MDPVIVFLNDNEALIRQAQLALTPEGYRIISWGVEEGAVELIMEHQPDLVIIDLWLGDPEGGWRVFDTLRSNPETARIPVIITSDHRIRPERMELVESNDHTMALNKPYDWDTLISMIAALLNPSAAK